jgi:hypothetical protein
MVVLGGRLQLQSDYIPERRTLRLTVVRGVALNAPLPASDTPISPYILIQLRPHNISSNDHVQTPEEMRTRVIEMTNAPEFNHTCEYLIGSSLQTRKWRLHIEAWYALLIFRRGIFNRLNRVSSSCAWWCPAGIAISFPRSSFLDAFRSLYKS